MLCVSRNEIILGHFLLPPCLYDFFHIFRIDPISKSVEICQKCSNCITMSPFYFFLPKISCSSNWPFCQNCRLFSPPFFSFNSETLTQLTTGTAVLCLPPFCEQLLFANSEKKLGCFFSHWRSQFRPKPPKNDKREGILKKTHPKIESKVAPMKSIFQGLSLVFPHENPTKSFFFPYTMSRATILCGRKIGFQTKFLCNLVVRHFRQYQLSWSSHNFQAQWQKHKEIFTSGDLTIIFFLFSSRSTDWANL